jgi:hypothetical protein
MIAGAGMDFGVFDHLDRNDLPLGDYFEARLNIIEQYDRAGFYCYHCSSHVYRMLGSMAWNPIHRPADPC